MTHPTSNQQVHELKCAREFFDAVESGEKPFEIRVDDRPFKVGDTLHLREVDLLLHYTGRETRKRITFILRGWGIKHGHVGLGLASMQRDETQPSASNQRAIWYRANAVQVPDVPEMIDHPGDTVSRFVAVSDGFRIGSARWHYPTKSWCHTGKYDGNVLFWSLFPSWESTSDETSVLPSHDLLTSVAFEHKDSGKFERARAELQALLRASPEEPRETTDVCERSGDIYRGAAPGETIACPGCGKAVTLRTDIHATQIPRHLKRSLEEPSAKPDPRGDTAIWVLAWLAHQGGLGHDKHRVIDAVMEGRATMRADGTLHIEPYSLEKPTRPLPDHLKAPVKAGDPCPAVEDVHIEHAGKCMYCGAPMLQEKASASHVHVWEKRGDFGGASCKCGTRADGWYCPDSPEHLCHYEKGNFDQCDFCGLPEERK